MRRLDYDLDMETQLVLSSARQGQLLAKRRVGASLLSRIRALAGMSLAARTADS